MFYEVREEEQWAVRGRRRNVDQVQGQKAEDKYIVCDTDLLIITSMILLLL